MAGKRRWSSPTMCGDPWTWRRRRSRGWLTSCPSRRKSPRSSCRRRRTAMRSSIPMRGRLRRRTWRACPTARSSPATASGWTRRSGAATRGGIIVTNVLGYCVEEVSDQALALLLACARKVAFYDRPRGDAGGPRAATKARLRPASWDAPWGWLVCNIAGGRPPGLAFGNRAGRSRSSEREFMARQENGIARRAAGVRLSLRPSAADTADQEDDQRRGLRPDEADRRADQL